MFGKRLPAWLYEPLPYAYIAVGVLSFAKLGHTLAALSGILLVSAGLLIWQQRRYYRMKIREDMERIAQLEELQRAKDEAARLIWDEAMAVGYPEIDRQHRRLFSLSNDLIAALLSKNGAGDVRLLLEELLDEIARHFSFEESFMRQAESPLSVEHVEAHRNLVERIRQLLQRHHDGLLPVSELIGFVTHDVVSQHIAKEDLKIRTG